MLTTFTLSRYERIRTYIAHECPMEQGERIVEVTKTGTFFYEGKKVQAVAPYVYLPDFRIFMHPVHLLFTRIHVRKVSRTLTGYLRRLRNVRLFVLNVYSYWAWYTYTQRCTPETEVAGQLSFML